VLSPSDSLAAGRAAAELEGALHEPVFCGGFHEDLHGGIDSDAAAPSVHSGLHMGRARRLGRDRAQ
jgi:hypothetical protein